MGWNTAMAIWRLMDVTVALKEEDEEREEEEDDKKKKKKKKKHGGGVGVSFRKKM